MSERFLPPTEDEIRKSIAKILRNRANMAAYFKTHFQENDMPESARQQQSFELIWLEAEDIALGYRKD